MKWKLIAIGIFIFANARCQDIDSFFEIESYLLKRQYDSAIVTANQYLDRDSLQWKTYYYLGKAFGAKNQYFKSEAYYEKALLIDSANYLVEQELAEIYDFIGKDEQAISIYYDQYLRDTTALEPVLKLADIFRRKREYSSAIHYYQKAVTQNPENFYYHKQLAFCFSKIDFPLGAIFSYKTAIMLNPNDLSMYMQLANVLNSEKMFSESIDYCNWGLQINPDNIQLIKIKAYAHYLNRDFDSAVVHFSKLLETGDTSYFNLKYRGLAFFEKKEFNEAVQDLELAYSINNQDAELAFYLGSALGRSDQSKEGMQYLDRSLTLLSPSPNELSNLYSEMALIYQNEEEYEKALDLLKKAYKAEANPLLSFKMAQLYDYFLNNKKMAINYYDGYLQMSNKPDTLIQDDSVIIRNSFTSDSLVIQNARERIRVLNEELFFEEGNKK